MASLSPAQSKITVSRRSIGIVLGLLIVGSTTWWVFGRPHGGPSAGTPRVEASGQGTPAANTSSAETPNSEWLPIVMSDLHQKTVGLKTERAAMGDAQDVLTAPGRIAPDEAHYVQITPRAAGVINSINAVIGQDVRAGDLLAMVDSPSVGEARLNLFTQKQALEIAQAQAEWQEISDKNTIELVRSLKRGESLDDIQRRFENNAVGENRERLITAYTQYRLATATLQRKRDLHAQKIISDQPLQEATTEYEVALATYQTLLDQTEFQSRISLAKARQAVQQAETAVKVARERLRILGIRPSELPLESKSTAGGTPEHHPMPMPAPAMVDGGSADGQEIPISAYALRAPFDGTILDRESLVAGVYVDTTHRIFTLANLTTVWVEANVHESDFGVLSHRRGGRVRFHSPAYPDRQFEGVVIYTGDLVDEKSRTVKLLARADNPGRVLKPGMFVEVSIINPESRPAVEIPGTALLTDGDKTFVYIKTAPDRFERRDVRTEQAEEERVIVRKGLKPGDEVVVEGGYKIKAEAFRSAKSE